MSRRGNDAVDNCLLEWQLALQLISCGKLQKIFPILVGNARDDGTRGDFFHDGSSAHARDLPDTVSAKTSAAVEH